MSPRPAVLVIIALTLALAVPAEAARMQGKVKHGVYQSPSRNFTVPVPQGMGMKVSDGFQKDDQLQMGAVSFHDDWGNLQGIHYCTVPEQIKGNFAEPAKTEYELVRWLENFAMPAWFQSASPQSRLLHSEFTKFEGLEVLAAEVEIPGGSALVVQDASGAHRPDSVRGLVVFRRGDYFYMLTTETKSVLGDLIATKPAQQAEAPAQAEPSPAPDDTAWIKFTDRLAPFYRTITFVD